MSDEKPVREDDAVLDADLDDAELDREAPGVDDAAELGAAEAELAAEAESEEDKIVTRPARHRRGRITAEPADEEVDDALPTRRAARAAASSRPAGRAVAAAGAGTRSRAAAERARAQEIQQRRSVRRFLREVVAELRKVIWPGRQELITYTIVVIIFVAFIIALVAGLDLAFTKAVVAVFG